jgi:cation diffusion facilitator CzcD-associated flavoprotein CzcO
VSEVVVAIIGAGPYGLSIAAHLAAQKIPHRIFGRPMQFWSQIAEAADKRFLKSYCFGTNLSAPETGFSFADYSIPRNLETFEPCSMTNFAAYGRWFQQSKVPWVEPVDVLDVKPQGGGFAISLSSGEHLLAAQVIVSTGLACFAHVPTAFASVPSSLVMHTSNIVKFSSFKGRSVAVLGAGQSALESAVLLHEAGAHPILLVRDQSIAWHGRVQQKRSVWRRLRSPISGLGTGPKAWALTRFPGAMHRLPEKLRCRFVKSHLPAEGAWWLRERFDPRIPLHLGAEVIQAREAAGRVTLTVRDAKQGKNWEMTTDHVVAGSGYVVDVDRLTFLDATMRDRIDRIERAPRLNATFESSVPGLRFVGPASAMSFGPLFRFVVGADYTARVIARHIASGGLGSSASGLEKTLDASLEMCNR